MYVCKHKKAKVSRVPSRVWLIEDSTCSLHLSDTPDSKIKQLQGWKGC